MTTRSSGGIERDLTLLLAVDALSRVIPFVVWPVLFRRLGLGPIGLLAWVNAAFAFVTLAANYGIVPYAVRELARAERASRPAVFRGVLKLRLAVAAGVTGIVIAGSFVGPLPPGAAPLLRIQVLALFLSALDAGWVFTALGGVRRIAYGQFLGQVAVAGATLAAVQGPTHLLRYVTITIVGAGISTVTTWTMVVRSEPWVLSAAPSVAFTPSFREVGLLGTASLGAVLYNKADAVMLGYMVTPESLGLYAAAYKVYDLGQGVLALGNQALYPRLAGACADARQFVEELRRNLAVLGSMALPGLAVTAALARPAVLVIGGGDFVTADSILRVLAIAFPVSVVASLGASGILVLTRRTGNYAGLVLTAGFVNVGLNLLLIPHWGILAAAWTTVISQAVVAAGSLALRPEGLSLSFLQAFMRPGLISVLIFVALVIATHATPDTRSGRLTLLAVGAALCGAVVAAELRRRRPETAQERL